MARLVRQVPLWARCAVVIAVALVVRAVLYELARPRPVLHVVLAMSH